MSDESEYGVPKKSREEEEGRRKGGEKPLQKRETTLNPAKKRVESIANERDEKTNGSRGALQCLPLPLLPVLLLYYVFFYASAFPRSASFSGALRASVPKFWVR